PGPARAGINVLDQRGARAGAVALPELETVGSVVRAEEERAVDVYGCPLWIVAALGAARAGVDVFHERGPGGGAVALPGLIAVGSVVCGEEKCAVDAGQGGDVRTIRARIDVLDEGRPLAVPSLFQSSRPWLLSGALKKSVPLTLVRSPGS